jgi:hypothetical protein
MPGSDPVVLIEWKVGWDPEPFWMLLKRKKVRYIKFNEYLFLLEIYCHTFL